MEARDWTFDGTRGALAARSWTDPSTEPRYVALLAHGYGEHIGRYEHVAAALVANGAAVYGLDHMGHGKSDGERVQIDDFEDVVGDLHALDQTARSERPGLPVVLIGHSMGGLIAARYAQHHGDSLTALVLSGPAIGDFELIGMLLSLDEMPDAPIDPSTLSRDPSVGEAYAADPLVWHGPFKRITVESFATMIAAINDGGTIGDLPLLWVHGTDDPIVPIEGTRKGIERLRGGGMFASYEYEGARHEVFNETNSGEVLGHVTEFIDGVLA